MADVTEIIRITEENSNNIDLKATIKNALENFYTEDIRYPFISLDEYSGGADIVYEIEKKEKGYHLGKTIDKPLIEEVFKNLEWGIFIVMATVEIKDETLIIKSTDTYEYSPEELGLPNLKDISVFESGIDDSQIINENEYGWHYKNKEGIKYYLGKEYDVVYGIDVNMRNKNMNVKYQGDFIRSGFGPMFWSLEDINETNEYYKFNTNNLIVQKVVEAIYNGIIFY